MRGVRSRDVIMGGTILFLLFMNLVDLGSAAIQRTRQWQLTDVSCKVSPVFDRDIATAFFEKELLTSGCVTNATSPRTGAEVHVIHYQGSVEQNVELFINDYEKKGFDKPFIMILSSNITIYWQVRLRQNPKNLGKHIFVVSKGSGLRFAYKHLTSRPTILKPKNLPHDSDDLLSWVTQKFSVVTTFTSVPGGNHLTTIIGRAHSFATSSPSPSSSESSCVKTRGEQNVQAVSMETQPVEGCLMQDRSSGPSYKVAYVIELKHVPDVEKFEVHLDLRGQSRQHDDQEMKLVLKAPSHVTWRVYTKKIQGLIHIVANSYVDMSGIRVETVSVRSEELFETGLNLLRWVQYYLEVPIAMYTSMNNSNRIHVTLPELDENEDHKAKQMKNVLTHALTTECDSQSVTMAIDKFILQRLGIKRSMLSLLDAICTASENTTHVYIQSVRGACGTKLIDTQFGRQALANALVVHDTSIVTEEDEMDNFDDLVKEGSGKDDIFSGSGGNEIFNLDDEDLELQPLRVNFMCVITEEQEPIMEIHPNPELQLQLFDNSLFLAPFIRFPVEVAEPDTRLYLQAIAMSDPLLRASLSECWLSPENDGSDLQNWSLIEESCAADKSVHYFQTGTPQSERLSFTLENYMKQVTSQIVQIQCEIKLCCISKKCGSYNYPVCPDRELGCTRHRHGNTGTQQLYLRVLGTLSLPQQITNYKEGVDTSRVEVETNISMTGEASSEDKDPVIIEGLDSVTVVGIAFAAFIIGAIMMGALWFIHTHSGKLFSSGPFKRNVGTRETPENEEGYVETTPGSSAPIST